MILKSYSNNLLFTALLMLWPLQSQANAPEIRYITLNGQSFEIVLEPTDINRYEIPGLEANNRFYSTYLKNQPDSRGRAALIDDQWQGLLIHNGQLHVINTLQSSATVNRQNRAMTASLLDPEISLGQCGYSGGVESQPSASAITTRSLMAQSLQIDFDSFCSEQIDGVCLVGELTLAFDDEFETQFGSEYQAQAVAIAEYVDLIYQQNFNIVFNKLNMAFGSGNVFEGDTDIDAVLDDIEYKRVRGQTSAFDPNVYSILHFITGRSYYSPPQNEAIGLALGPTYGANFANYPTPDIPLLCTGYAIGTSQVFGSGSNRAAFTSLIVAHEIGHNFGFLHDGDDAPASECSASDFIMGPELSGYTTTFSSCSEAVLAPNINGIGTIEDCFNFPVDASIDPDSGNPEEVQEGDIITAAYTVSAQSRSDRSTNLRIQGNINSSAATFLSADVDGSSCSLSNSDTTYTCTINSATTHNLELEIQFALSDLDIQHQVSTTSADDFDVTDNNNTLAETIRVGGGSSGSQASDRLGGGSGGTLNWLGLSLILLLLTRVRHRS